MFEFLRRLFGQGGAARNRQTQDHWTDHERECPRCDGLVPARVSCCPNCGEPCTSDGPKLVRNETLQSLYEAGRYFACDQCQCQQRVYPILSSHGNCEICHSQLPQARDVFPRLLVEPGDVRRPAGEMAGTTACRQCTRTAPTKDRLDAFYWTEFLAGGGPQKKFHYQPPWAGEESLHIRNPRGMIQRACRYFELRRRRETDTPDFTRTPGPSVPIEDALKIERAIDIYAALYEKYVEAMGEPPAPVRCLYLKPCAHCGEKDPLGLEGELGEAAAPYLKVEKGRYEGWGLQ